MPTAEAVGCAFCHNPISSVDAKDSAFCNACWWDLFHHPSGEDGTCEVCGDNYINSKDLHKAVNPFETLIH